MTPNQELPNESQTQCTYGGCTSLLCLIGRIMNVEILALHLDSGQTCGEIAGYIGRHLNNMVHWEKNKRTHTYICCTKNTSFANQHLTWLMRLQLEPWL